MLKRRFAYLLLLLGAAAMLQTSMTFARADRKSPKHEACAADAADDDVLDNDLVDEEDGGSYVLGESAVDGKAKPAKARILRQLATHGRTVMRLSTFAGIVAIIGLTVTNLMATKKPIPIASAPGAITLLPAAGAARRAAVPETPSASVRSLAHTSASSGTVSSESTASADESSVAADAESVATSARPASPAPRDDTAAPAAGAQRERAAAPVDGAPRPVAAAVAVDGACDCAGDGTPRRAAAQPQVPAPVVLADGGAVAVPDVAALGRVFWRRDDVYERLDQAYYRLGSGGGSMGAYIDYAKAYEKAAREASNEISRLLGERHRRAVNARNTAVVAGRVAHAAEQMRGLGFDKGTQILQFELAILKAVLAVEKVDNALLDGRIPLARVEPELVAREEAALAHRFVVEAAVAAPLAKNAFADTVAVAIRGVDLAARDLNAVLTKYDIVQAAVLAAEKTMAAGALGAAKADVVGCKKRCDTAHAALAAAEKAFAVATEPITNIDATIAAVQRLVAGAQARADAAVPPAAAPVAVDGTAAAAAVAQPPVDGASAAGAAQPVAGT